MDEDETTPEEVADETPETPAVSPVSMSTEAVLASAEYQALQRQNRKLARQAGAAQARENAARTAAEVARQAAEAQQQAAVEQQIADILGEEGVSEWNAIAELASTNQVEAARRLAALMQRSSAQSPVVAEATASAGEPVITEGAPVEHPTPAAPSRSVDASAPLTTSPGDDVTQLISSLEADYAAAVEKNQNPVTRQRMTTRERGDALIKMLGAAYLKAGARPKGG